MNEFERKCLLFNELIKLTFKGIDVGRVSVIDLGRESERLDQCFGNDCNYQQGDVLIDYDFMDDELSSEIAASGLLDDMINEFLQSLPGEQVNGADGSGGGLFYGAVLLRV